MQRKCGQYEVDKKEGEGWEVVMVTIFDKNRELGAEAKW